MEWNEGFGLPQDQIKVHQIGLFKTTKETSVTLALFIGPELHTKPSRHGKQHKKLHVCYF